MSTDRTLQDLPPLDGGDFVRKLRDTYLAMVEAVVAEDGLGRVAAIAGRATGGDVAIVVPRLGPPALSSPDVHDADLVALRGHVTDCLRNRPSRVPEAVVQEVPIRSGERTVGLVALLTEPTRASLLEATELLHLAAAVAITKVAIEDTRDEVESGLRDTFLEELRSAAPLTAPEIMRRAIRFGCDVSRGAIVLCAEGETDRPHRMVATIASAVPGALTQSLDGRVYAVLPAAAAGDRAERTAALAEDVAKRLRRHGWVGISSFYENPADLRRALAEAELMVDVLRRSGAPPAQVIGTGSYRLLLRLFVSHPDDVWEFYDSTVGPLVSYDEQFGTDLLRTLESYLQHNCNMNATAVAVFAHRHTIAYRLERIRELSGLDPAQSDDRERLGLGVKAYRILAPARGRESGGRAGAPVEAGSRRRDGRDRS
jgi:sugar diacid utilization regulator